MKYLVEELLPARLLLEVGIYLQTCAHLELAVWQIVLEANGVRIADGTIPAEHVEPKLNTSRLKKELRCAATLVKPEIGIRIHALSNEIEDGTINRNAAAHGAFFLHEDIGELGIAHFFADGRGKSRQIHSLEETVTREVIEEALEAADRLLREAIEIQKLLQQRRPTPPRPSPPPPSSGARP